MTYHLSALSLLLAACGGGGAGGGGTPGGSLLKGNVVAVNGQSSDVSGVVVQAPATGALAMSDVAGAFDLGTVPAGTQRLAVQSASGNEAEIEVEVEDGGEVRLRLSVDDDGVVRVSEDRCGDDGASARARARLTAQEPGLEGHVDVRADADGSEGFDVEAEGLAPGRAVQVVVIDPATGVEETVGSLAADDDGEAEVELRTNDGDRLPFDVAGVADLADLRVEVRDTSTGLTLLSGDVPSIGSAPLCDPEGDIDDQSGEDDASDDDVSDDDDASSDDASGDDDDDSDDDRAGEGRLANQGVVSGSAQVELRSRPARGEEKIEVHVEGSDAVGVLEVWLEDPASPGTLVNVGVLTPEDDGLEFERDTGDGDVLPFGVAAAADLVGLAVEVRRASDGAVLFAGTTPPLRIDG